MATKRTKKKTTKKKKLALWSGKGETSLYMAVPKPGYEQDMDNKVKKIAEQCHVLVRSIRQGKGGFREYGLLGSKTAIKKFYDKI